MRDRTFHLHMMKNPAYVAIYISELENGGERLTRQLALATEALGTAADTIQDHVDDCGECDGVGSGENEDEKVVNCAFCSQLRWVLTGARKALAEIATLQGKKE